MSHGSDFGEDSRSPRSPKPEKEMNMNNNMCSPRAEEDTNMSWQCDKNGHENALAARQE